MWGFFYFKLVWVLKLWQIIQNIVIKKLVGNGVKSVFGKPVDTPIILEIFYYGLGFFYFVIVEGCLLGQL